MPNDLVPVQRQESIWKKLTRLFRSGPIVRHKIASGETYNEPMGTARAYKKELSSLYVHSMASYGQYERLSKYADFCFHPDTLVYTTEGIFTIKELSEKFPDGRRFSVYAYDAHKKRIVIADAHSPRLKRNGEECDLVRVVFDDGGSVVTTPDHQILLRDGTKKKVCDLSPGESLMPFYRRDLAGHGYQWIYVIDKKRSAGGWRVEHKMVVEHIIGREILDNEVVHHMDFNPSNNHPSNLMLMDKHEHLSFHAKLNNIHKTGKPNGKIAAARRKNNPVKRQDVNFAAIVRAAIETDFNMAAVIRLLDTDITAVKKRIKERGFINWEHFRAKRDDIERGITFEVIRFESSPSIDDILSMHAGCNTLFELACKLGCTEKSITTRLRTNGYGTWVEFKKRYDPSYDPSFRYNFVPTSDTPLNHKVARIEPAGRSQVYNVTVEEYHNLAVGSSYVQDKFGNKQLSACFYSQSEMEYMPEIHSTLDIVADEVTAQDEHRSVVNIVSQNGLIKKHLETLFYDILNIEFNLWSWTRNLCKYGDFVMFVDASEENGILNLLPIPINEIEREEGYDKNDPFAVRFRWLTQGNKILENWQIVHFRLLGNDGNLPYGTSYLESARRIWRQLILIEDAMMVYRIVRSPERRVFYIEVGNASPDQIDLHMEQVKNRLRRNQIVDPTSGRVDLRYNPLPVRRNTLIPLLDGRTLTIEELAREHDEGRINWVYSIQDGTKRIVPGRVAWCGKNYVCDRIHRVWLDDGTYLDTAGEHPFVMSDGSSKRADELSPGDSLMVSYRDLNNRGYERLVEPNGDLTSTHVMVARDVYFEKWQNEKRPVVHHKTDLGPPNKRDNNPDRLEVMDFWEHRKYHQEHVNLTLNTPEKLKERGARFVEYNRSEEKRKKTSEDNRKYQKAQMMGAAYNGSELHRQHNEIRRKAQKDSWSNAEERARRSESMRWIIPNEVIQIVFDRVKQDPSILRSALYDYVKNNEEIRRLIADANSGANNREVSKFHCRAIESKLKRMGELPDGAGFVQFREYAATHPVPLNHQVVRVEVLDEVDDVYCMTVVGSRGEDDRHNFAAVSDPSNSFESPKSLIFLLNSVDEDIFIPIRDNKSSRIETLAGGAFTGDIEDVEYIQRKLFAALKVPKAYLSYEAELGSKATLAQQDVRFSRTIERIQRIVIAELNKIAIIHLFLLGYRGADLVDFEIQMANSSTIAEQQKLELWRMKLEILSLAQEGILDTDTAYRDILGFSKEKIERVRQGKRFDRLEALALEAMQLPPELGAPIPGEEELPTDLGANVPQADQEQLPPPEPEVAPEGVQHEKHNPGSSGDRAELAVDKGKDLFAPGEDPHAHAFGTKKQTATDPGDLRAMRRLVTRPFSERVIRADHVDDRLSEAIDRTGDIDSEIRKAMGRLNGMLSFDERRRGPRRS